MRTHTRLGQLVQRLATADWFARHAPGLMPRLDRLVHRLTGGRMMLSNGMLPVILLTTTGAKSGLPRESPLAAVPLHGHHYIVGSNFGGESHPSWSYNLVASPRATMSLKGAVREVEAHLLTPEQREHVWPELTRVWPPFDTYVERSGRDLRVFRLVEVSA
jgi:deazaflavin-dependent oxidoreductase (nitroreductase family)